jgi:hypothetical protein
MVTVKTQLLPNSAANDTVERTKATQDMQAGKLVHTLYKQPVFVDHLI